jgi:hypothetical protein
MNIKQNILLTCVIGSLSMGAFAQKACDDITTLDVAATLSLGGFAYQGEKENLESDLKVFLRSIDKFSIKVHSIENLMNYDKDIKSIYTDAIAINVIKADNLNGDIDSKLSKLVYPIKQDKVKHLNDQFLRTDYSQIHGSKLIDCQSPE